MSFKGYRECWEGLKISDYSIVGLVVLQLSIQFAYKNVFTKEIVMIIE